MKDFEAPPTGPFPDTEPVNLGAAFGQPDTRGTTQPKPEPEVKPEAVVVYASDENTNEQVPPAGLPKSFWRKLGVGGQ